MSVAGVNIAKPHTATIGRGERFAIPFYLEYGTYKVSVTMNDVPVVETEVLLDHNKPYQKIDLKDVPSPVPTTSGATTPRSPDFLPANDALRGLSSPPPPFPGGGSGVK